MTLPSSGQLDFNSIRAEFGGPSSNVTMSTYYRGSSYTYAVPANSNITTSATGQIEVPDFYGAENGADYLKVAGGSYNPGGKAANDNYGCSNALQTGLPAMVDTTMKVGSTSMTGITEWNVTGANANPVFRFQFEQTRSYYQDNTTSRNLWGSRAFLHYNTSGALAQTFTMGNNCGYGKSTNGWYPAPFEKGTYASDILPVGAYRTNEDTSTARGATGNPVTPFVGPSTGSPSNGSWLNATLYVKAF